MSLAATVERE